MIPHCPLPIKLSSYKVVPMLMFPHSNCFRAFALSSRAFSQDYSWLRFPTGEVSHPPDSVFSHTSTGRPVESVSAPLSVRVLCWLESSHGDGIYTSGISRHHKSADLGLLSPLFKNRLLNITSISCLHYKTHLFVFP